jgi:hypothetical protein
LKTPVPGRVSVRLFLEHPDWGGGYVAPFLYRNNDLVQMARVADALEAAGSIEMARLMRS